MANACWRLIWQPQLPANQACGRNLSSIPGANHFTFSDQMLVKNRIPLFVLRHVGIIGPLGGLRGLRIAEAYVMAFFDVHLEGQPRTELDDLRREYRKVDVW